eukprot:Colp12_sorted_trinity150504_noHs@23198
MALFPTYDYELRRTLHDSELADTRPTKRFRSDPFETPGQLVPELRRGAPVPISNADLALQRQDVFGLGSSITHSQGQGATDTSGVRKTSLTTSEYSPFDEKEAESNETYDDGSNDGSSDENESNSQRFNMGLPNHKASELRSRQRLRQSMAQLVGVIPELANVKNPSKATIMQAATTYSRELKQANEGLRRQYNKLRSRLHTLRQQVQELEKKPNAGTESHISVLLLNKSGMVMYSDASWQDILGWSIAELRGGSWTKILDEHDSHLDLFNNMKKLEAWTGTVQFRRKDGKSCKAQLELLPIKNLDNNSECEFVVNCHSFQVISGEVETR